MHIFHTVLNTFVMLLTVEFVKWSRASWIQDHSLYSHDLDVWSKGDTVGRN